MGFYDYKQHRKNCIEKTTLPIYLVLLIQEKNKGFGHKGAY